MRQRPSCGSPHATARRGAIAIAAALAVTVSACGGSDDAATGSAEQSCPIGALDTADGRVEVTIWHNYASLSGKILDEQIAAFNKSQKRVKVVGQFQGSTFEELQSKVEEAAVDKELPGLVTLEDTKTRWAADSGLFSPAQACIDSDPEVKAQYDDLLPIVKSSYEMDGTLYPVSFGVFTALVYYNQTHFEAAGLDPSVAPATIDEMEKDARAIKAALPDVKPIVMTTAPWVFEWWMSGIRQELVDKGNGRDGVATTSGLASEPAVKLLEQLQRMKRDGLIDVVAGTPGQVDHMLAMAQQQSSIVVESSSAATTVAGVIEGTIDAERLKSELKVDLPAGFDTRQLGLKIEAGPIPGIESSGKGQVGGAVWYLPNTNSRTVQAGAWEFVQFLNRPENQAEWTIRGSNAPAFRATVDEPALQTAFTSSLGGRWQKAAYEVLESGVDSSFPGPIIGPYTEMRTSLRKALDSALLDDKDARESLEKADAEVNAELELYAQDIGG